MCLFTYLFSRLEIHEYELAVLSRVQHMPEICILLRLSLKMNYETFHLFHTIHLDLCLHQSIVHDYTDRIMFATYQSLREFAHSVTFHPLTHMMNDALRE